MRANKVKIETLTDYVHIYFYSEMNAEIISHSSIITPQRSLYNMQQTPDH